MSNTLASEHWKEFGEWMRRRRLTFPDNGGRELPQSRAAELAGISRGHWIDLENGVRGTRRETVIKIAKALKVEESEAFAKAGFLPTNQAEIPNSDPIFEEDIRRALGRIPADKVPLAKLTIRQVLETMAEVAA